MGSPRKTVESEINGREIGRGTVVRWLPAAYRRADSEPGASIRRVIGEGDRTRAVGIVERLTLNGGARVLFGRQRCVRLHLSLHELEPIGEVKRMPKCGVGEGHWLRPSNRSHRSRETEIGRLVRQLQGALNLSATMGPGPHDEEIRRRLVNLDRKLERLPIGPRRKHR